MRLWPWALCFLALTQCAHVPVSPISDARIAAHISADKVHVSYSFLQEQAAQIVKELRHRLPEVRGFAMALADSQPSQTSVRVYEKRARALPDCRRHSARARHPRYVSL